MEAAIVKHVPPSIAAQLFDVLSLMNTRLGGALLLGTFFKPLSKLSVEERQRALLSLASSALFAGVFKVFKGLSVYSFYSNPDSGALAALGYRLNTETDRSPAAHLAAEDAVLQRALLDLTESATRLAHGADRTSVTAAVLDLLRSKGLKTTHPETLSEAERVAINDAAYTGRKPASRLFGGARAKPRVLIDVVIDGLDAVVCGSGAGGGVAAHELASKGLQVLVLEKGMYYAPAAMAAETSRERHGFENLYEAAGLLASKDGSVAVLAGSTLGGGTTINWGASWRTPDHVRKEWAEKHGLTAFAGSEYDQALDEVATR